MIGKLILLAAMGILTAYGLENDFALAVTAWGAAVATSFWIGQPMGWMVCFVGVAWIAYGPGGL